MRKNPDFHSELLRRVEQFVTQLESMTAQEGPKMPAYIQECAESLYSMVEGNIPVFGYEHWHGLDRGTIGGPAELLLRLKDPKGEALSPYEFVMACYSGGLTAELDAILVLSALDQYSEHLRDHGEKKVSVNMSARFLEMRNQGLIETILRALESLKLNTKTGESIIFEIHESAGDINVDPMILELFRKNGVQFAMDDVAMDGQDIYRFSGFSGFTDFVKIDHEFLKKSEEDPTFFAGMIDFIRGQAPGSTIVAEGVQNTEHARRLFEEFKHIGYVQGRYLPDRQTFSREWSAMKTSDNEDNSEPSE